MKRLIILGAGTAGTIMANLMRRRLRRADQGVRLVQQPGQLRMGLQQGRGQRPHRGGEELPEGNATLPVEGLLGLGARQAVLGEERRVGGGQEDDVPLLDGLLV